MKTVTFVEFMYPGSIVSESTEIEVDSRELSRLTVPKAAYAFRFFDIQEAVIDGEKLKSKNKNYSGFYFPEGKEYTPEQVAMEFPHERILNVNIKCNGYNRMVCTRRGNWYPMNDNDQVI